MKIAFHGAARTVTGSKHLITLKSGIKYLLDCGMFQGLGQETDGLNRNWGFIPAEVNFLILSHAHIDHSGLIPKLVKDGFSGKIYCTPATKELTAALLEDSAVIQQEEFGFLSRKKLVDKSGNLTPLYDEADAKKAMDLFQEVEYENWHEIDEQVQFMYTDAGHIIGSAAMHLIIKEEGKETRLTFSGDVGRYGDVILKSPADFPQSDYILIESTYGDSLHDPVGNTKDLLLQWVEKTCLQRKGKLIIPAFSVGRTQEILFALNQLEADGKLPAVDYFVDSPLSIKVTEIVKKYPLYFNKNIQNMLQTDSDPFSFRGLKYIETVQESKSLNFRNAPCVIISASGMADAGRVKHHISNSIENSRNAILLVGYCEPNSLGGKLMSGIKEVNIFGVHHQVNAEVGSIRSMSAHGDYKDLTQFLASQDPKQVKKLFIVHGEYQVQQAFQQRLIKKGFDDVEIPPLHFEVGLS
jgi:metallo-beta-lactamase family protein